MQLSEVDNENEDGNIIPGVWRDTVQLTIPILLGQRITVEGKLLRNIILNTIITATWGAYPGKTMLCKDKTVNQIKYSLCCFMNRKIFSHVHQQQNEHELIEASLLFVGLKI